MLKVKRTRSVGIKFYYNTNPAYKSLKIFIKEESGQRELYLDMVAYSFSIPNLHYYIVRVLNGGNTNVIISYSWLNGNVKFNLPYSIIFSETI